MASDPRYADIPELLLKLSEQDRNKHGKLLERVFEVGDCKIVSQEWGKGRPYAYGVVLQMRRKYSPETTSDGRKQRGNSLDHAGLTKELALHTIRDVAKNKKAPMARLRAAETMLKAHGELSGTTAIGGTLGKSNAFNVVILSDSSQFENIMVGGTYQTEPVATDNAPNEVSPTESVNKS